MTIRQERIVYTGAIMKSRHRQPVDNLDSDSIDSELAIVPIVLDRETRRRLVMLGHAIGEHPARCAASLLHDIMHDDEVYNASSIN